MPGVMPLCNNMQTMQQSNCTFFTEIGILKMANGSIQVHRSLRRLLSKSMEMELTEQVWNRNGELVVGTQRDMYWNWNWTTSMDRNC